MFIGALLKIVKKWNQPRCLTIDESIKKKCRTRINCHFYIYKSTQSGDAVKMEARMEQQGHEPWQMVLKE
jgi:hypothetical protein